MKQTAIAKQFKLPKSTSSNTIAYSKVRRGAGPKTKKQKLQSDTAAIVTLNMLQIKITYGFYLFQLCK